jgi:DNA-binding response OmpR family regulator
MEIILVEDETNLRAALCYAFGKEGWSCRDFPDGQAAWDFLSGVAGGADGVERVVVADVTMPRMDGLELCRRLRELDARLPWLFLSSRDEEADRIAGLETGADDYLCKPFSVLELLTRLRVLHRRAYATAGAPGRTGVAAPGDAAGLALDAEGWRAWLDGRELALTVSEFRILACLAALPGTVKTRAQLQQAAYPDDLYLNERSVDCHIKRLRRKLAAVAGAGPGKDADGAIETVYGLGYRYRP